MKITFFINTLSAGGKERRLVELMKGLRSHASIEFQLVVMSNDIHYTEVYDMNVKIFNLIRSKKNDPTIFSKFYKICRDFSSDIVHCCDGMTAVYALPACKLLGIKLVNAMVVDCPEKSNFCNKNWLWGKLTFPFSDVVVGNSQAGLNAYSAPKDRSALIHNGFNFSRIKNLQDKHVLIEDLNATNKYIIGMVASFSEKKDYRTFFEAARLILKVREDVVFVALGKDTDSLECRRLLSQHDLSNFRLLGKRSDVESIISVMDICVLATFTEGISNAILEYMALGKPVIATDGGGTKEIIVDNKTGYLVKSSNAFQLSDKINFLLNNSEKRLNFGSNGLQRIKQHFSIEKMVAHYLTEYSLLVKERKN